MEKHGRINIFVNILLSGILSLITAFAGMLPSNYTTWGIFCLKSRLYYSANTVYT